MMPKEFWDHLQTHYKYQSLYWYHSPLLWDRKSFRLLKNPLRSIKHWLANAAFLTAVACYCLIFLILGIFTDFFDLTFFQIVVASGELLIASIGFVLCAVSLYDQGSICQCLNGIFKVARSAPKGILVSKKKEGSPPLAKTDRSMLMLLSFFRRVVILAPWLIFCIPFTLSSDPIYILIDGVLHIFPFKEKSWLSVLCGTLLQSFIFLLAATHLVFDAYQFVTFLAILLYVQLKLFSVAFIKRKWSSQNTPYKFIVIPGKNCKARIHTEEYARSLNFQFVYGIYRQIQIIDRFHEILTIKLYPPLFALVYCGGVLAGFVVLTGFNHVPFMVYVVAVCLAIVVLIVFSFVFPRFCDFDICSEEFYIFWERRLLGKYNRSRLASLRPVRVGIKPFFNFKRRQYMLVVWNMISFSITFFITFKDAFL